MSYSSRIVSYCSRLYCTSSSKATVPSKYPTVRISAFFGTLYRQCSQRVKYKHFQDLRWQLFWAFFSSSPFSSRIVSLNWCRGQIERVNQAFQQEKKRECINYCQKQITQNASTSSTVLPGPHKSLLIWSYIRCSTASYVNRALVCSCTTIADTKRVWSRSCLQCVNIRLFGKTFRYFNILIYAEKSNDLHFSDKRHRVLLNWYSI